MSRKSFTERRAPDAPVEVVLGCMNFGKRTSAADSEKIIARAIERGVTAFDTANAYADGESERVLGKALAGRREQFQIATKVGFGRGGGKPEGLSRARILSAIDESLARLGMDHVDLYYLHVPDATTPITESLAALGELVEQKKIGAVGVSNYAAWEIVEMLGLAREKGTPKPAVSQVLYNLLIRQIEIEYVKLTKRHAFHTTVYNPLAGGLLSGRHTRAGDTMPGSRFHKNKMYQSRYWSERFFDLVEAYRMLAAEAGLSLVELSYMWLAGQKHVDSILVGPGSLEHLDAALDAIQSDKKLDGDLLEKIDQIHKSFQGTDASYVR